MPTPEPIRSVLSGRRRRLLSCLAAVAIAVAADGAGAIVINRILATIDGDPVTLYEVKAFTTGNPLAAQLNEQNPQALLDALITSRLIRIEVESRGISIGDAEIDNYITQIRQQNQLTEEQLYQVIAEQGLSREAYRAQIREELERAQLINREIRGKVNVTPEDIERYYTANLSDYEQSPEVTVSHIMFRLPEDAPQGEVDRAMQRAEQVHEELEDGEDFADLARQYSEDPAAEGGGSLGTFRTGTMLDALNDAVEDLDVGEYSDPVRSSVGIHIVRLDARSDAAHTPIEELSDGIREKLYAEALEKRYARWLTEDLRERHHVEMIE